MSDAATGPDDIPKKGNPEVFGQILFAKDKVEYHGQPLGLIVAKSQVGHLSHSAILLLLCTVTVQYSNKVNSHHMLRSYFVVAKSQAGHLPHPAVLLLLSMRNTR